MQHLLILCLTTPTLSISWVSETQQKATKHSKTQRAQNVSTCLHFINKLFSMFLTIRLEKSFFPEKFCMTSGVFVIMDE